jgi:hypothetical protein
MVEREETAAKISELILEFLEKLNASVVQVRNECSPAEFETYRTAVATIIGNIVLEVMNPLYRRHPHLKPREMV